MRMIDCVHGAPPPPPAPVKDLICHTLNANCAGGVGITPGFFTGATPAGGMGMETPAAAALHKIQAQVPMTPEQYQEARTQVRQGVCIRVCELLCMCRSLSLRQDS
jgi:hypothetical protein